MDAGMEAGWPHCRTITFAPDELMLRSHGWRPRASIASSTRCTSAMSRKRSGIGIAGELQPQTHRAISEKFYRDNDQGLLVKGDLGRGHHLPQRYRRGRLRVYIEDLRLSSSPASTLSATSRAQMHLAGTSGLMLCCGRWDLTVKSSHRVKLHFHLPGWLHWWNRQPHRTRAAEPVSPISASLALCHADFRRPGDRATLLHTTTPAARSDWWVIGMWWRSTRWGNQGSRSDTIQIMKDFMANGRFSRGAEVIADASLSFVGNIDLSVQQVVNSDQHDLFQPLLPELDLAVMDCFAAYIPGWRCRKTAASS